MTSTRDAIVYHQGNYDFLSVFLSIVYIFSRHTFDFNVFFASLFWSTTICSIMPCVSGGTGIQHVIFRGSLHFLLPLTWLNRLLLLQEFNEFLNGCWSFLSQEIYRFSRSFKNFTLEPIQHFFKD
jgi:hypothetical protein